MVVQIAEEKKTILVKIKELILERFSMRKERISSPNFKHLSNYNMGIVRPSKLSC